MRHASGDASTYTGLSPRRFTGSATSLSSGTSTMTPQTIGLRTCVTAPTLKTTQMPWPITGSGALETLRLPIALTAMNTRQRTRRRQSAMVEGRSGSVACVSDSRIDVVTGEGKRRRRLSREGRSPSSVAVPRESTAARDAFTGRSRTSIGRSNRIADNRRGWRGPSSDGAYELEAFGSTCGSNGVPGASRGWQALRSRGVEAAHLNLLAVFLGGTVGTGLCVVASPVVGDELGREVTAAARRRVEAAAGTIRHGWCRGYTGLRMRCPWSKPGPGVHPFCFW